MSGAEDLRKMTVFRDFFSRFAGSSPLLPEPFGFKMGWLAVRSLDPKAVARALPIQSERTANWQDGIRAAYESDSVFITPPVHGWVCVVGLWAAGTGERESVDSVAMIVAELSGQFGEAHGYATHRVVEYHHWILAKKNQVIRRFAYLGESGEVLCQEGEPTEVEGQLPYAGLPRDEWASNEEHVMTVAASWSFDPTTLTAESGPPAIGILARMR